MIDLRNRVLVPEVMDDPALAPAAHAEALDVLARINWLSGSAAILWPALRDLARALGRPLRILDVATGAGDVPVRLWKVARRNGLAFDITGVDRSPVALDHARRFAEAAGADIAWQRLDVLTEPLPGGFDAITSSLFLHHLTEAEATHLLGAACTAAGTLVLVNDLERSLPGWILAFTASRVLTRSPVVRFDAPQSVAAAFTRREAVALARRAGLTNAHIGARWPFRWLLRWQRTGRG